MPWNRETVNGRPYIVGHTIAHNGPFWANSDVYDKNPTTMSEAVGPGIVAQQIPYYPRELEAPESTERKRVFTFEKIEWALDYLAKHHPEVGFIVTLHTRSFQTEEHPVIHTLPDWAINAGIETSYATSHFSWLKGGHDLKWWDQRGANYYVTLCDAINQRFRSHPNYIGIQTSETATGYSDAEKKAIGYDVTKHIEARIEAFQRIALAAPDVLLIAYANWLQDGQTMLYDFCVEIGRQPYGVCIGGPDILPFHEGIERHWYSQFRRLPGDINRVMAAQYDSMRNHPADLLYKFARDSLGVHAVQWNRPLNASAVTTIWDAMEYIATLPPRELDTILKSDEPCRSCTRCALPPDLFQYLEERLDEQQADASALFDAATDAQRKAQRIEELLQFIVGETK